MTEIVRNQIFELDGQDKGWHGYILDRPQNKLIEECLNTFVQWVINNEEYDFDHVEVILKRDTVGIKWHVRTPKPNPAS